VAYEDRAFPIGEGQTISQPYTVAYQTQLLETEPFMKVLEIGTGSAYQAVVLAEMSVQLFTIERQKNYLMKTGNGISLNNIRLSVFFMVMVLKASLITPFDRILITAAAPFIPQKLIEQLSIGGKMVIPLGAGDVQQMMRITKLETGVLQEEVFENFSFVPMLKGKNE
jgi:protein-L-isoaspartate(D-aspartate) O-methyltransferase